MVVDPPRGFMLDGDHYRLRKHWLDPLAMLGDNGDDWCLSFLLEAMKLKDADYLSDRLRDEDDELDIIDIGPIAVGIAESAFGTPWYTAARLHSTVTSSWVQLDGNLASVGVDIYQLLDRTPARGLAVVRHVLLNAQGTEDDISRVTFQLENPPADVPMSRAVVEEMANEWLAAAAAARQ